MLRHNKIDTLKWCFIFLFISCFISSYSQSHNKIYISTYAKEFKQVKKTPYNVNLISLSDIKPDKKWNSYKGNPINTTDSLFYFGDQFLATSFPSNADKIRNEYLAFYFSQKTAKCPTLFSLLNYYEPIIEKNLKSNNLPLELKLLPLVCSAFNPNSDNGLGGSGYWHLNYPQAIKYGLTVNRFVDERKDFDKSTKAAINYIKDLYAIYNNWELTLTAYSCGVSTVNKLLNRHLVKTYKEIYPFLQKETKDLVQAFVAMNYVYSYDNYGAVNLNPIINRDTILIDRKLKFEAINHVIKTSSKELIFLNPVLNQETFPNNFTAFFPKGFGDKFIEFKDSIYFYQDSVMLKPKVDEQKFVIPKNGEPYVYTVRSGDVLGLIADRHNVRVSQLQDWNGLNGTRINIGQKLTIYGKKASIKKKEPREEKQDVLDKTKTSNEKQTTNKPKIQNPKPNTGEHSTYTVKSGDNLWIIAKKYSGVSAQNIMDYNGIDGNLNVGQVIKIPKY